MITAVWQDYAGLLKLVWHAVAYAGLLKLVWHAVAYAGLVKLGRCQMN